MQSEKVVFNPKRSQIDFKLYEKIAQTSEATEKGGKERYNYSYSEENPFTVITQKQNFKLHTYREQPKTAPQGILIFLHGFGSFSNKFAFLAKEFAAKGIISIGFDFRGFGQSKGIKHGMLSNYMDLIEDLKSVIQEIDKLYPKELHRFLLGESMGGMAGIMYGIADPTYFKGMIFFSPAIIDNQNNAYFGKKICWWLDLVFLGNLTIAQSSPKPLATKNIEIFEESLKNPLIVSNFVIPHSVNEMKAGMEYTHKNLSKFQTDFCCVQAGIDKLVDIKGAFDLVEQSQSKEKTLIFLPTAWHCISVETELLDILDYLTNWVLKKCQV